MASGVDRPRATVVASGSELVRGDRYDRNGPFLAASLLRSGVEPARIVVVGDGAAELEAVLRAGLEDDLLCVSGGLGPTHDDRTVELLAAAAGVGLRVDAELEAAIEATSRAIAERLRRPYADFAPGVRKQATLPEGAVAVAPVGTAPAVVLPLPGGRVAVALPGPPRELQALWPAVLETAPLRALLARAQAPARRIWRLFGISESAVAQALAEAGGEPDGVAATICAREFEIHVDLLVAPGAEEAADRLEERLAAPFAPYVYARSESTAAEAVLAALRGHGLRLATAESCTGGLVAARLTAVPGSSDVFLGAVVAYANEVKAAALGVDEALLAAHGAVSAEVAQAMAEGARRRLGADVAVAVTGVAGPGGGTAEKPVGLVYLHAAAPGAVRSLRLELPGDRETVRLRAAVSALHLVRRLVTDL